MDGEDEIAIGPQAVQKALGIAQVRRLGQAQEAQAAEVGVVDLDVVEVFLQRTVGHLLAQRSQRRQALEVQAVQPLRIQMPEDVIQGVMG